MKAVITAAGLGTRFLPASKAVPKEMLPVIDKPVIQYVVEEALAAGADEVIIVTNDSKRAIQDHFSQDQELVEQLLESGKPEAAERVRQAASLAVSFVRQDRPLGLGHAVNCARAAIQNTAAEPFYLLLGDIIVPDNRLLQRLREVSAAHGGASVLAVLPVPPEQVRRFGVIAGNDLGSLGEPGVWQVTGMVEKPQQDPPSNLAIFGRYLLTPTIFGLLADTPPGAGGEIQLTDALVRLLASEEVYALVIDPGDGFDVGTVESWLQANFRLASRLGGFELGFDLGSSPDIPAPNLQP